MLSIATTYKVAKKINDGPLSYVQLMLLASFIPDDLRGQLVSPICPTTAGRSASASGWWIPTRG